MAEANFDSESDLSLKFQRAANHMTSLVGKLDSDVLLKFYGFYKQSTVGPCDCARPGWFQTQARYKWDAWHALKEMNKESAMEFYIKLMDKSDPDWDSNETTSKSPGWVAVSTMTKEDDLDEDEKTIFDYVKEGDAGKVMELFKGNPEACDVLDEDKMGLIHWAADRGSLPMMKMIVTEMKADVNMRDGMGQTALHYAASCGHADIVRFLLDSNADATLIDEDDCTPLQVASDRSITQLLTNLP